MITKRFGVDFNSECGALTLSRFDVTDDDPCNCDPQTKTHSDGWTITGVVHEDYYSWVNNFEAVHPQYGRVWGNFEGEVHADSEEGFNHFYKHHTPQAWDYQDI